ncbi:D-hexose-6-phosphate mutarotase [Nevskia soli]|uniref:D-hexose-6-phosphate mutarotase n=1 Tax=Nevskia soli TaxID=418856 RepID=UPI000561CCFC|nr:D-hexose-6-phosphate mutarotase [Nevskia soli]
MRLTPGEGGLQRLLLTAADGARAEIYQHGAHITSWVPAGGSEQLYLSRKAQFKPGAAIRGGVPVIFPQFAGEGPLPKHGFARGLSWRLVTASQAGQGSATAVFGLDDDDTTRAIWPHPFKAELRVTLGGAALETMLSVENTGESEISFTAALHTYLRVAEIGEVRLHGLQGLHYRDTAQGGVAAVESAEQLRIEGEVDRIYFSAPARLELSGAPGRLHIESAGFPDAVVWNPGAERGAALSDLDQGGYRNFLCVEAAAVGIPVKLAPGARWSGTQRLLQD